MVRRPDLALRTALGASRGRLVRQMLAEGLVLSLAAAALALFLARGSSALLLSLAPPDTPRLQEVAVGGRVLGFVAGLSIVVTGAFAVLPALRVTAGNLARAIRSEAREGEDRGARRLRSGLLVAELALATLLVASSALLARSLERYQAWEPGFDPDSLIAVSLFVDIGKHPTRAEFMEVLRRGEERVSAVPGVQSASTASAGPLFGGGDGATPFLTGDEEDPTAPARSVWWFDVGPGYFATLGLPVLSGREVEEGDRAAAEPVAVVNRSFATAAWGDDEALGRSVRLPEQDFTVRVVGVVADVPPLRPGEAVRPEIYWSNRQLGRPATFLLVRTSSGAVLAGAVVEALREVDPDLSIGTPFTLAAARDRALVRPRFQTLVIAALAAVALLISTAGVYAVVSYSVARRVREMGIRRVLGATSGRVTTQIVRSVLILALPGVALGLAGALWMGRIYRALLPGVSAGDPPSLLGTSALLLLAATLAALVPAQRAGRTDPLAQVRGDGH